MKNKNVFYDSFNTEVLVVGGGYAGIKAAFECAKAGLQVTFLIKTKVGSGSSFYPLMEGCGCLAPRDDADKALFLEELEETGIGMGNSHLNKIYIEEIHDRVEELPEIGFEYQPITGRIACFAKRERDIIGWFNLKKISSNVREIFSGLPNAKIMEFCDAILLVKKDNRILGAVAADFQSRLIHIKTKNIIMAAGGYCGLYKHSLNTDDVCGLGQIMSLEAGAKLINLEFIQFIPGMLRPVYKTLFSEQTLRFCDAVLNENGSEVLSKYLPEGVTVRECIDSRAGHGPFTCMDNSKYFDMAMMKEYLLNENQKGCQLIYSSEIYKEDNPFIKMYLSFLDKLNINLIRDKILIAPFGHAANGGVFFNENCETGVEGLYVAGEVAGGLHGADRIGGLASGSCLVFGKRAANSVIHRINQLGTKTTDFASDTEAMVQYESMLDSGISGVLLPDEVIVEIKSLLWKYANVIRNEKTLNEGLEKLNSINASYNAVYALEGGTAIRDAVKARHSLKMARILLEVMKERKESRGAHYREDYPHLDDKNFKKHIVVCENEVSFKLEFS